MSKIHRFANAVRTLPRFEGDPDPPTPEVNLEDPKVKAAIAAAVEEATKGLKSNRDEILGEKRKLSEQLTELQERWKDLDPSVVRNLMSRIENDEEAKLLAEGKVDEVLERRTERLRAQAETDVKAAQEIAEARQAELDTANSVIKELVVDAKIRAAAGDLGLVTTAVDDAIERGRKVFSLDDEKNPVALEKDGSTIRRGKDGKTPLSPKEWLEGMKEAAPHWWAPSNGGGAAGSGSKERAGDDQKKIDSMSPRDKLSVGLRASQQ